MVAAAHFGGFMFLICGEAIYDVFEGEETDRGVALDARIGGSPFNVAVGLARLGRAAGLLGGLSTDPLGRRLDRALSREGVSTTYIARKDAPTTLALVGLGPDGGARYTFYGDGAADRVVHVEDLPEIGADIAAAHFGSYTLVTEPTASSFLRFAKAMRSAGRLVSLDPNVRPTVEPDLGLWRDRVALFAAQADLVKVSEEDLALLYPDDTLEEAADRFRVRGAALVVVTLGAAGAAAFKDGEAIEIPGVETGIVDTVGAGDTFMAALLCALDEAGAGDPRSLADLPLDAVRRMLTFASRAAAVTCGRRGADLPRRADIPDASDVDA